MAAYKLSFAEILASIKQENVNIPGGSIVRRDGYQRLSKAARITERQDGHGTGSEAAGAKGS